jgi:hypothetical protein
VAATSHLGEPSLLDGTVRFDLANIYLVWWQLLVRREPSPPAGTVRFGLANIFGLVAATGQLGVPSPPAGTVRFGLANIHLVWWQLPVSWACQVHRLGQKGLVWLIYIWFGGSYQSVGRAKSTGWDSKVWFGKFIFGLVAATGQFGRAKSTS